MLQKVFAIIGCVFICIILSLGLGIGSTIFVDSVKDRMAARAEGAEEFPSDEGAADSDRFGEDDDAETP